MGKKRDERFDMTQDQADAATKAMLDDMRAKGVDVDAELAKIKERDEAEGPGDAPGTPRSS